VGRWRKVTIRATAANTYIIKQALAAIIFMKIVCILGFMTFLLSCSKTSDFDEVVIDPSRKYNILHEDSVYDYYDGPTEITADLFVDDCSSVRQMCEIKFSEAKIENDTLDVEIFETNSITDYHFRIKLEDGRFGISYWYQMTLDTAVREIKTIKQILVLDKGEFKSGEVIRGYTEYIGQCTKGCVDVEMEPIHIKGNFKVTVK